MVKPYYQDDNGIIYQGHVLDILKQMEPESVQCVVTSPPYLGLRDYGLEPQIWEAPDLVDCPYKCEHEWGNSLSPRGQSGWHTFEHKYHSPGSHKTTLGSKLKNEPEIPAGHGQFCQLCGAWRGSLGLEPTSELYVKHMVEIFREVRRVLRKNGTLWLNLGDSYAANRSYQVTDSKHISVGNTKSSQVPLNLKPKDLCGIPWRVAFALQNDGWWLRSDIIWSKNNPMPESVTDRPTRSHEYIFLLTKSARYFFDQDAVRENATWERWGKQTCIKKYRGIKPIDMDSLENRRSLGRNVRTVWTISTQPFPDAHFATFPPKLVEPCIKAGSRKGDIVADLFGGSGTVGMLAEQLGRKWVIIDLSEKYCEMAKKRILSKAWGPQEEDQANWIQEDLLNV